MRSSANNIHHRKRSITGGYPARALLVAALSLFAVAPCYAACNCVCVDGLNRPLCSSVSDIKPLCPPRVCPRAETSRPLDGPQLRPPAGTQSCSMQYLYNRFTQRYEWRQMCQ